MPRAKGAARSAASLRPDLHDGALPLSPIPSREGVVWPAGCAWAVASSGWSLGPDLVSTRGVSAT
eukprot:11265883-Alexandrium_andersonii.AAC.1